MARFKFLEHHIKWSKESMLPRAGLCKCVPRGIESFNLLVPDTQEIGILHKEEKSTIYWGMEKDYIQRDSMKHLSVTHTAH